MAVGLIAALCIAPLELAVAQDEARRIVDEVQKRSTSKSQRYEGVLQSFNSDGKTSEKRWRYERIGSHGQSKAVIRFTEPAEVRGVALLVVNHPDRASDQWMWTPALERDRRIALQDRSTRFFGTDFSFEDLEERDSEQYDYALLGEQQLDGKACWMIESTPRQAKSSQYTKSVVWIRKDIMAIARIDSYVKNQVVRRLDHGGLQNVQGIWTARELTMRDLRRGTTTRLLLDKVEYNAPINDSEFTLQALRRG
jgi:outer membrane lipoprotein-sorting protein